MRRHGKLNLDEKLSVQTFKWPQVGGYQSCQLKHDENIETCLDEEYAEDHLHWYCASESEV